MTQLAYDSALKVGIIPVVKVMDQRYYHRGEWDDTHVPLRPCTVYIYIYIERIIIYNHIYLYI